MNAPWPTAKPVVVGPHTANFAEAMRKFMIEFGLTPSSRSRIRVPDNANAASEFDIFMQDAG